MTTTCPFCGAQARTDWGFKCGSGPLAGQRSIRCRESEVARLTKERDEAREDAARMRVDWDAHRREIEQTNDIAAQIMRERDEARAEVARLKSGGCARDQRTTQFCAEAVALQERVRRLEEAWIPASTKPEGWERRVLLWTVYTNCGWRDQPEPKIGWWKHGPGCFAFDEFENADHLVTHWMEITDPTKAKEAKP